MATLNELIIDGVATSSFKCNILVETRPTFIVSASKTNLIEHDGISGALTQTNKRRPSITKSYHISLIDPSEEEIYQFSALLNRERFWLENEQEKSIKYWCYKVEGYTIEKDENGAWIVDVSFQCHPTKFFKKTDNQSLSSNGVLKTSGSALAYPKITLTGSTASETHFTIGEYVIRLENLNGTVVMVNDPDQPSFKTNSGRLINWSGDFIEVDPTKDPTVGVVLGPGIQNIQFSTIWGWA